MIAGSDQCKKLPSYSVHNKFVCDWTVMPSKGQLREAEDSQVSMQLQWKVWLQGRVLMLWDTLYTSMQMEQSSPMRLLVDSRVSVSNEESADSDTVLGATLSSSLRRVS